MKTAKTSIQTVPGQTAAQRFPTATHQSMVSCLLTEISVYLKAREPEGRAVAAPFAVFFKNPGETCVQPDITVVQDMEKLDEDGCHGAPDWVIEIVSPESRSLDHGQKLGIYINEGVREYWIVDPEKRRIAAYHLEDPDVPVIYHFGDIVRPAVYPDLVIDSSLLARIQYRKTSEPPAAGPQADRAHRGSAAQAHQDDPPRAFSDSAALASSQAFPGAQDELKPLADPGEVKAFLREHFAGLVAAGNRGQLLKAAMGTLKGRAESRTVNEAVAELCR